eukprot:PhF_6_TR1046/c0_g1_i4/m.2156
MQYTPQQMSGHKGFSCRTLVGNWNEDVAVEDSRLKQYMVRRETGTLLSQKLANKYRLAMTEITLTPLQKDNALHFDDVMMMQSAGTQLFLAVNPNPSQGPRPNFLAVTCAGTDRPTVRFAFVLRKVKSQHDAYYAKVGEDNVLHYGQPFRFVNEYCCNDGYVSLQSQMQTPTSFSKASRRQEVAACLSQGLDTVWVAYPADRKVDFEMKGEIIPANTPVLIKHQATNVPLSTEDQFKVNSVVSQELEVCCFQHKLSKTKFDNLANEPANLWAFVTAPAGSSFVPFNPGQSNELLDRVKRKILERGGSEGTRGLIRSLKLFDDNGDRKLSRIEFKEGLILYGIQLSVQELDVVFKVFDRNGDGVITITEFLRTLRGDMNERRTELVREAFKRIDTDLGGTVTFDEIKAIYSRGLDRHPAVTAGEKSPDQVLREFILCWDKNGDATVTMDEFIDYYNDLSCNIENDDYFELMIRNAWHMSGGSGWSENTTCRRVLVTHTDGRQTVEEIKNDLGITKDDIEKMRQKLIQQGVTDIQRIELYS